MKSLNEKINQIIIESNEDVSLLFTNLKGDIFCECKKDEQVVLLEEIRDLLKNQASTKSKK